MTNIKERVLQIADYKNITKEKFLSSLGMTYGSFKGKAKEGSLNSNALEKIYTNYGEIDIGWLLTGKGDMIVGQQSSYESSNLISEPEGTYSKKTLPFYNISATASDLHRFHDSEEVPDGFIRFPGVEECDFAIPVYGDSMSPEINSGDYIAVKLIQELSFLNYGVKYLIITSEQRLVKYLYAHDTDHSLLVLRSANKHHQDIVIEKRLILKFYLIRFVFKREI